MSEETDAVDDVRSTEYLNGGVTVREQDGESLHEVTLTCVGCGERIKQYETFPGQVEEALDQRPLCNDTTAKCLQLAKSLKND